jgi:preprotein translocase SecE subunit
MGVKKYTQEVIKEGKRVRWPKKEVFFPALITVIVICVFAALVLSLEDFVAGSIINTIRGWFSSMKPAADTSSSGEAASSAVDAAIKVFLLK